MKWLTEAVRNDKTTTKMKRTLKSKNVATITIGKGKKPATSIEFKDEPTEADIKEAEALAVKQKTKK